MILKIFLERRKWLLMSLINVVFVAKDACCAFDIDLDYLESSSWEEEERVIIEQGRNKSFTCKVVNVQFFDVVRVKLTQGNKTLIISDNGDIKEPFGHLTRYKIDFDFIQDDNALLTLSYHGILGEDSGILSCQKLSSPSAALLELIVLVPPTSIQMSHIQTNGSFENLIEEPIDSNGIILLQEKELHGIRCSASVVSSTRAPWVKMMVDGVEMDLQPVESVVILPPNPPSSSTTPIPQELSRYESSATITLTTDKPNPAHHGRLVTCTARTDKIFESLKTSAVISVRYQPVITCPMTSYEARSGDNVTLTCELDSNPEGRIKWLSVSKDKQLHHDKYFSFHTQIIESNEKSLPLSSSSSSSSYPSSMTTTRKRVMMTISRIKEAHFGSYAVSASNEIGRSQVELTLSKMASSHVLPSTNQKLADRPSKQMQSSRPHHRPKGYSRSSKGAGQQCSLDKYFLFVSMATTCLVTLWIRSRHHRSLF